VGALSFCRFLPRIIGASPTRYVRATGPRPVRVFYSGILIKSGASSGLFPFALTRESLPSSSCVIVNASEKRDKPRSEVARLYPLPKYLFRLFFLARLSSTNKNADSHDCQSVIHFVLLARAGFLLHQALPLRAPEIDFPACPKKETPRRIQLRLKRARRESYEMLHYVYVCVCVCVCVCSCVAIYSR